MLNRWLKIVNIAAGIAIVVSAIVAPGIMAIFWLAQLDSDVSVLQHDVGQLKQDVRQLQKDVGQLQVDVGQLQVDMAQVKADIEQLQEGQQIIIQILQGMVGDAEAYQGRFNRPYSRRRWAGGVSPG